MGCEKQNDSAAWWGGEQQRTELSNQLELQKFRFEEIHTGDLAQLDGCLSKSKAASAQAASLRRERDDLGEVVKSLERRLADFKETTLRSQRQQAMRKTFETLHLASGRTFENVSVSTIDDSGVTIRHTHGSARLRFQDLDPRQQQFFGLEADLALAAHEKEAREAVAYEHWIAKQMEITRLSETAVASVRRINKPASLTRQSDSPALRIVASNVRPLAQPARSVGSGDYRNYRYSSYRSCRPTYQNVYYDAPHCMGYPNNGIVPYSSQHCPVEYFHHPAVNTHKPSFANTTIPSDP